MLMEATTVCTCTSIDAVKEQLDIKRIQKSASHIILGENYELTTLGLDTLRNRRDKLCLKFGKKAEKHIKFQNWFKPAVYPKNTRQEKLKNCGVLAKNSTFKKSPLSFLTSRLNDHYIIKKPKIHSFKVNYSDADGGYYSLYLY